jgi:hypothetical protein
LEGKHHLPLECFCGCTLPTFFLATHGKPSLCKFNPNVDDLLFFYENIGIGGVGDDFINALLNPNTGRSIDDAVE